jgi:hypothetical protein
MPFCCIVAGADVSKTIKWHDREECTYIHEGQCSCSLTRQLIPMPAEHIPVQPSRTPLEAGLKLLEHWALGTYFYRMQQLHGQDQPAGVLEEGFDPLCSYAKFAVLVDVEEFIREALHKVDSADCQPGRGPAKQRSANSSQGAARLPIGAGKITLSGRRDGRFHGFGFGFGFGCGVGG